MSKAVVRVGVGVLVKDPRDACKVFCGIRKNSHGAGSLALPGGHLEMYETWEQCARREVEEECGLILDKVQFAHVTNDPMPNEGKHYVTIFVMAECQNQDPKQAPRTLEPHKCEGWYSYSWSELVDLKAQSKLFGPLERLVHDSPATVAEFLSSSS